MHELSITRSIVAIVCERAINQQVTRVCLEIGCLSAIQPEAVRFCFDVCAKGTAAEGATLEIMEIPGRGSCSKCGVEVALTALVGRCPVCNGALTLIAGEEMKIKEMEVESCA
ncbi:MAG: hydrogenase maturation nickel metallochaperone HypA [Gallionellaceae bacterium]|nr:hydrogenase maturation nickel metallochaperone HypA [Gallionellaceae bacterium]